MNGRMWPGRYRRIIENEKLPNSLTLKAGFEDFVSRCTALNLADGTLAWYDNILRELGLTLAAQGIERLEQIQPEHLRAHLTALRRRGHASETVFRVYGALRCAFRFWRREKKLSTNPMELLERPRRERALIRPLSPEQAAKLLDMPDTRTSPGLRDRAMIALMLDTGLRVSEVLSLEVSRIDWVNCSATVMGKGRKERMVPFSARTGQVLLEYTRERAKKPALDPQFFLGRTGRRLERTKVRKLVVRYGKTAGIEGVRVSPHTLRHTFAVMYVRNGGDSFSLQEILGHSTLEMTRRYVHLARHDVAEQHKKYSPMESLLHRTPAPEVRVHAYPPSA